MDVRERVGDLADHRRRAPRLQGDRARERVARHELGHEVEAVVELAELVDLEDVRVAVAASEDLGLALEAAGVVESLGALLVEDHLEREAEVERGVLDLVDDPHAAPGDLADDLVGADPAGRAHVDRLRGNRSSARDSREPLRLPITRACPVACRLVRPLVCPGATAGASRRRGPSVGPRGIAAGPRRPRDGRSPGARGPGP